MGEAHINSNMNMNMNGVDDTMKLLPHVDGSEQHK